MLRKSKTKKNILRRGKDKCPLHGLDAHSTGLDKGPTEPEKEQANETAVRGLWHSGQSLHYFMHVQFQVKQFPSAHMSLPDSSQRTWETVGVHLINADREIMREEMGRSKVQEQEGDRLKKVKSASIKVDQDWHNEKHSYFYSRVKWISSPYLEAGLKRCHSLDWVHDR